MEIEEKIIDQLKKDFPGRKFEIKSDGDNREILIDGNSGLVYSTKDAVVEELEQSYPAAAEMAFDEFYGIIEQSIKMVLNK